VAPPPGERAPFTFGSFNQLAKLTPETVNLWSRVLLAVPGSRLLLKARGLADPGVRARLLHEFGRHQIAPARIEVAGQLPGQREHLAAYGRVDVALDPSPYNGTTTTCEALWMGVPVLALEGSRHASRVGLSLLAHVGLRELVAGSGEAFVEVARTLAADRARLRELRGSLRERVKTSPLTDGLTFTKGLERLYLDAFARACDGAAR
jgi:predicted O-linked N-acetylglucosamine transferase (SPINDLY family)